MMRDPARGKWVQTAATVFCLLGVLSAFWWDLHEAGMLWVIPIVVALVIGLASVLQLLRSLADRLLASAARAQSAEALDPPLQAMADASGNLFGFLQELDRTPRCERELDETPGLENIGSEDNPFAIGKKLAFLVYCDLRDTYVRLGHDPSSLRNREGVGYAMMVLLLLSRKTELSWFGQAKRRGEYLKIVEDLSATEVGDITIAGHEGALRFALIFGELHGERDWTQRYAALLYRWASLVAKANGTVDARERAVLQSLVNLRDAGRGSSDIQSDKASEKATYQKLSPCGGLAALQDLIGLEPVKREVRELASFIDIQRKRKKSGLRAAPVSYHCVFTGNPGTGKTTVARILAEIYRETGVVKKGHLIETDRSGLVGEYVGQTAVKTNKVVDAALDGVLFIDEAYALIQGGANDYGHEAVATLLKRMEDGRERLVVILAGYNDEMQAFLASNPGLQSRFNRHIAFPDYTAEELAKIFLLKAEACQYACDGDVRASLVDIMRHALDAKDRHFGNGRFVRNLFETAIQRQAVRLSGQSPLTSAMLSELTLHDLGFSYDADSDVLT